MGFLYERKIISRFCFQEAEIIYAPGDYMQLARLIVLKLFKQFYKIYNPMRKFLRSFLHKSFAWVMNWLKCIGQYFN